MKVIAIAVLLVSTLFGVGISYMDALRSEVTQASSDLPFRVKIDTSDSRPGYGSVTIRPAVRDNWADYIAANTSRINTWVMTPPGTHYFAGRYVLVTFSRPVDVEEFRRAVDPLLGDDGTVSHYVAVGKRLDGRWGEEWVANTMPDASLFVERIPPPRPDGTQERYTVEGIMQTGVMLGSKGGSPTTFIEVGQLDFVHLVDTTAIQVANDSTVTFESYGVLSPYYLFLR